MEVEVHYLAYGSNMAAARLQQRLASAEKLGLVQLPGHRLTFDNYSTKDHSGKCAALPTGNPADQVLAVLYRIDPLEKPLLDGYEGLGVEYRDAFIPIIVPAGESAEALIYYAINLRSGLKPYHWYLQHVLQGARENGFPAEYLAALEQIETIDDTDPQRSAREQEIYR